MARLRVPVPLRWSDLDAYGHVNNVEVLRLLEEARIAAFWRHTEAVGTWPTALLDAGPGASTHTLVARQEIEYLRPLGYRREPVTVEMWVGHLGGASIDVCYQVTADADADGDGHADANAGAGTGTDGERTGHTGRTVFVQAQTTLVLIDAASGRPRRISRIERDTWEPYLEAPVVMRRRPG